MFVVNLMLISYILCQHRTSGQFPGFSSIKWPNMEPPIHTKVQTRVDETSGRIQKKIQGVKEHLVELVTEIGDQRSQLEIVNMQAEVEPDSVAGVNARIQKLVQSFPNAAFAVCPKTQGYVEHKLSGLWYKISDVKAKRQDALRLCLGKKASLVKLNTKEKVTAMEEIVKKVPDSMRESFYIGADYFLNKTKGFQWMDKTFLDPKISPWDEGFPSFQTQGPRKDCVIAVYIPHKDSVVWRNVNCWEEHRFICQI